jgi:hypothetical protein
MYTRPYDDNVGILIPESYNGTALREDSRRSEDIRDITDEKNDCAGNSENAHTATTPDKKQDEPVGNFLSKLSSGNFLGGIFNNAKFGLQKIGTEEILIIATAAFLFFSKDGDKECAIMLLLLLFLA